VSQRSGLIYLLRFHHLSPKLCRRLAPLSRICDVLRSVSCATIRARIGKDFSVTNMKGSDVRDHFFSLMCGPLHRVVPLRKYFLHVDYVYYKTSVAGKARTVTIHDLIAPLCANSLFLLLLLPLSFPFAKLLSFCTLSLFASCVSLSSYMNASFQVRGNEAAELRLSRANRKFS